VKKIIAFLILFSVIFAQGQIVPKEKADRDLGEVTYKISMSTSEIAFLLGVSLGNKMEQKSITFERASKSDVVYFQLVNGKLEVLADKNLVRVYSRFESRAEGNSLARGFSPAIVREFLSKSSGTVEVQIRDNAPLAFESEAGVLDYGNDWP